jgi:hypothetical protein
MEGVKSDNLPSYVNFPLKVFLKICLGKNETDVKGGSKNMGRLFDQQFSVRTLT